MIEMGALEPAGTQAYVLRRRQNKQRFPGATFGTAARWQTRAEWADRSNGGILQHDRAELDRLATGGYFRSCAADADDIGRPVWHQVARVPLVEAGGRPAENHAANFQHCGDNGPGPGGYAPFEDSFGTGKKVSASCKICGSSGHWGFECTLGQPEVNYAQQPRVRGLPSANGLKQGGGGDMEGAEVLETLLCARFRDATATNPNYCWRIGHWETEQSLAEKAAGTFPPGTRACKHCGRSKHWTYDVSNHTLSQHSS